VETGDDPMAISTEFPHPNHKLKFPALNVKMVAIEATLMMCNY
jgi:hypothetical protein